MTIHVSIGEAQSRLASLVDAAMSGEDVIIDQAGVPKVRIVAVDAAAAGDAASPPGKREKAIGMWKHLIRADEIDIPPSMTDEELEERWQRKFGPAA